MSARSPRLLGGPLPTLAVHPWTGPSWLSVIPTIGVLGLPGRLLGWCRQTCWALCQGPGGAAQPLPTRPFTPSRLAKVFCWVSEKS